MTNLTITALDNSALFPDMSIASVGKVEPTNHRMSGSDSGWGDQYDSLRTIIRHIDRLAHSVINGPYGNIQVAPHVRSLILPFLFQAVRNGDAPPQGMVAPDGDGGLKIEWIKGEREVRFVIGSEADERPYIYWEDGNEYDLQDNVSPSDLAQWLRWLSEP